jgi:quercetin dioxygenase-like cupin family protein
MTQTTETTQTLDSPPKDMTFRVTPNDEAEVIPGRREFFEYRDFGIAEASNGYMKVTTFSAKRAMDTATGWHYHVCGAQLIYIIKGWAEVAFEDGVTRRMSAGAVIFIPGGSRHNEMLTSDDFELLEIVVPSSMDTVPVGAPEL